MTFQFKSNKLLISIFQSIIFAALIRQAQEKNINKHGFASTPRQFELHTEGSVND